MAFRSIDTTNMNHASSASMYEAALRQMFECQMEELLWLAEAIVGDLRAAGNCVAAAMLRADGSAYVAPNWREGWIKRCVVREAVERNGTEIKRIAAHYIRDASFKRGPDAVDLDKQSLRSLTASRISETLNVFERAAFMLHAYLGFSTRDCALLLDCHWLVIEPACSNGVWRLFEERGNTPNEAARLGFSEVMG
jgi:DNA-directed RNA polymerase specialized sigma24 family protein